jgi:hypothetical protein
LHAAVEADASDLRREVVLEERFLVRVVEAVRIGAYRCRPGQVLHDGGHNLRWRRVTETFRDEFAQQRLC